MITLLQSRIPHAYFLMVLQVCNQATHLGKSQGPAEGGHRAFQVLWQVEVLEEWKICSEYGSFPPTSGERSPALTPFAKYTENKI